MIYNISGNFHFLGFDVLAPLDIEASSCQLAKDIYKNNFSNFTRLKDLQDYLIKTNRTDILNVIPQESEYSAIICIDNIKSLEEDKEEIVIEESNEEVIEENDEVTDFSSVTIKNGSSAVPGLETALRNRDPGTYKIKIVDHEPIIIGRPVDDQNTAQVLVEHPMRRYRQQ